MSYTSQDQMFGDTYEVLMASIRRAEDVIDKRMSADDWSDDHLAELGALERELFRFKQALRRFEETMDR